MLTIYEKLESVMVISSPIFVHKFKHNMIQVDCCNEPQVQEHFTNVQRWSVLFKLHSSVPSLLLIRPTSPHLEVILNVSLIKCYTTKDLKHTLPLAIHWSHIKKKWLSKTYSRSSQLHLFPLLAQCEIAIKTSNCVHTQTQGIEEVWRRKSFYVFFSFKWNFYALNQSENYVDVNTVQGIPVRKHQPFWQAHAHWRRVRLRSACVSLYI